MALRSSHLRAVAAAIALLVSARSTFAGATLLSRDTVIHASGGATDQQQAISHFDRFADQVGAESGPDGLTTLSSQNSQVGVDGLTGFNFTGAFGEGQTRTLAPTGGRASAQSNMDLMFLVTDRPAAYTIGAAMGSSGTGSTLFELTQVTTGQAITSIFSSSTARGEGGAAGASREIDQHGFLAPGEYSLRVHADTNDLSRSSAESNAYFTYSFSISDASVGGLGGGGGPPVAVPLPPAIAAGAVLLALIAGGQLLRRRKQA